MLALLRSRPKLGLLRVFLTTGVFPEREEVGLALQVGGPGVDASNIVPEMLTNDFLQVGRTLLPPKAVGELGVSIFGLLCTPLSEVVRRCSEPVHPSSEDLETRTCSRGTADSRLMVKIVLGELVVIWLLSFFVTAIGVSAASESSYCAECQPILEGDREMANGEGFGLRGP
ncbi:hypothetical protein [Roseomonas elaeocarpi]|uniref:Uncharacterized protein n=1 Tax=Roseomonas elaeocarpi TaxID=907779 RepID=A0ABV6JNZ5_9PROT